jgi:hypothetical protein
VRIEKSSLAATLLEIGEDNAAVLLIRSPLPEHLDSDDDLAALTALGLDSDTVTRLIATAVEVRKAEDNSGEHLRQTISRRCADLVQQWNASRSPRQNEGRR